MKPLPQLVVRAPSIFYGLGVLVFFLSFSSTLYEIYGGSFQYASPGDPLVRAALWRGFTSSFTESIYLAANGVLFHILLAFWDRYNAKGEGIGK